jgi:E3 ubiquitin-protein ligase HUWE1
MYTSDDAVKEAVEAAAQADAAINSATGFVEGSAVSEARLLVKPLAEAEALLNLTTALLRSTPQMLPLLLGGINTSPGMWRRGVIGRVGALQRDVTWLSAALSKGSDSRAEVAANEAKSAEAAKQVEGLEKKQGTTAKGKENMTAAESGGDASARVADPVVDTTQVAAAEAASTASVAASANPQESSSAAAAAAMETAVVIVSTEETRVKAAAAALSTVLLACAHFRTSSNYFCSSLAKASAGTRHRHRGDDPNPSLNSRSAACELAAELTHGLNSRAYASTYRVGSVDAGNQRLCDDVAQQYLGRVLDDLYAVLIDQRRRSSQGLVLNYMRCQGGVDRIVSAFRNVWRGFQSAADEAREEGDARAAADGVGGDGDGNAHSGDATMTPADEAQCSNDSRPRLSTNLPLRAPLPAVLTSALQTAAALVEQLVNVGVLMGSSVAGTLLTAPYPSLHQALELTLDLPHTVQVHPTAEDAQRFAGDLHEAMLPAVLEAWESPALADCPEQVAMTLMAALQHLGEGTSRAAPVAGPGGGAGPGGRRIPEALRAAAAERAAPPPFVPSPSMMASIGEMGFSEAQARAALIAVRGSSIELAMDWLFTHPAQAAAADAAAEAEAAGVAVAAAEVAAGVAEVAAAAAEAAARMIAGVDGSSTGSDAASTQQAPATTASGAEAVGGTGVEEESGEDAELMRALAMSMDEEDDVAVEVGVAAVAPADTAETIATCVPAEAACIASANAAVVSGDPDPYLSVTPTLPTPSALIAPLLRLSERNEAMAFSSADLLVGAFRRADQDARTGAISALVAAVAGQLAQLTHGDDKETHSKRLRTAVHLLTLVLVTDVDAREVAAAEGLVDLALGHLETFLPQHRAGGGNAVLPGWTTGLLLAVHALAQWRGVKAPSSAEPGTTGREAGGGGGGDDTESRGAPVGGGSGAVGSEAKDGDGGGGAGGSSSASQMLASVLGSPMGFLDEAACVRATEVCIQVLSLTDLSGPAGTATALGSDGDDGGGDAFMSVPPGGGELDAAVTIAGARTSDGDVGGVQAALQLLVHLTKDHLRARAVLDSGCLRLLLDLPCRFAFPAYDALAASILRHVVEDPVTLQAAMESEIYATMNAPGVARSSIMRGRASVRTFLSATLPVIAREPVCFLAALEKCTTMEDVGGRRIITLRRDHSTTPAPTPAPPPAPAATTAAAAAVAAAAAAAAATTVVPAVTPGKPAGGKGANPGPDPTTPKSQTKGTKHKLPATFTSVIDALVAAVLAYPPPTKADPLSQSHGQQTLEGDAMDATEAAPVGGASSGDAALLPLAPAPIAPAPVPAASGMIGATKVPVSAPSLAAVRASLALRLLTDFTLVYSAAAGQILRRDTEGGLLRHVLYVQLPAAGAAVGGAGAVAADPGWDGGERAAYLLLAMCVRSPEARRRILAEVSSALKDGPDGKVVVDGKVVAQLAAATAAGATAGAAGPARAFVDLVNSLLSHAGGGRGPGGGRGGAAAAAAAVPRTGLAGDLQRGMREAELLPALCAALHRVDLNDGAAPTLVNAILRPLEVLTRSGGGAGVSASGTSKGVEGSGAGAGTDATASTPLGSAGSGSVGAGRQSGAGVGLGEGGVVGGFGTTPGRSGSAAAVAGTTPAASLSPHALGDVPPDSTSTAVAAAVAGVGVGGVTGVAAAGRAPTSAVAPSGAAAARLGPVVETDGHDTPAQMAQVGSIASQMFDTLMGQESHDHGHGDDDEEDSLDGEGESGEEDDESGEEDEEDSDSDEDDVNSHSKP